MRPKWFCTILMLLVVSSSGHGPKLVAGGAAAAGASVEEELKALDRQIEAAILREDKAYLDQAYSPDFVFTHGDGWRNGGKALRTDTKASWLASLNGRGLISREVSAQQVEMHGDVALTMGKVESVGKSQAGSNRKTTLWYVHVYKLTNGRWQQLSHRTVDGPTQS